MNENKPLPAAARYNAPCKIKSSDILTATVQNILENPLRHKWTIQGFGMLRTYLPFDMRLNVWNSGFRVPDVSMIHTHPWHFDSYIERGRLMNMRYERCVIGVPTHEHVLLQPGPQGGCGGVMKELGPAILQPFNPESYGPGERYHQDADEIHLSLPSDGCVTINARTRVGADEALVFWPIGNKWVSAEPRGATDREILAFCVAAIKANGRFSQGEPDGTPPQANPEISESRIQEGKQDA